MILVVDGQRIYNYEYQEPPPIATNSLGFIDIEFRLSEEWDGYICTAQFVQHKVNGTDFIASKVLYNNHVTLPDGITPGVLEISLFGYKAGEAERGTTFPYIQPVCRSGFTSTEETPIPPTPDLYSQFLESLETTKQSIENDKLIAQNAAKDAIIARDYAVKAAESAESSEQNAIKTLEAIKETSTELIEGIETAGETQLSNVQSEGATQIRSVKDAGNEKLRALSEQGDIEQRKVIVAGDEQVSRIASVGDTTVSSVETAGTEAVNSVKSAESAAIQNIGTGIDDTLSISGRAADAKKTGDSISALKDDLDFLHPLSITSFSVSPNLAEKGSTVSSEAFSFAVNRLGAVLTLNDQTVTGNSATRTDVLTADKTYTLKAALNGATKTATSTIKFVAPVYYGVSASYALENATVLALTRVLTTSRARTFTVNAAEGQYILYALPASLGTPTFKVGGFEGGFVLVGTFDFTNGSGHTESYRLYRSVNSGLGSTSVSVS